MRRREFIIGLAGAAARPPAASGKNLRRINEDIGARLNEIQHVDLIVPLGRQ
jgi:hypothetical protein